MKKALLVCLAIVSSLFISLSISQKALAYFFGGTILSNQAPEIRNLINSGYDCEMQGGKTIEVNSIMGPTSYFIPSYSSPVTNFSPFGGQQILGIYDGQTTIVCTRDEDKDQISRTTVILDNITYFGTSQY